jgi:RNA polymerase sigma-70 factor, ECF subfamily
MHIATLLFGRCCDIFSIYIMDTNLGDEEYIRQVRAGNTESYRFLMQKYESALFRYVLSVVKDDALATDVVQETFIKAYINLQAFDVLKKFSSWLYRIAHNESLNAIKRWRREVSLEEWGGDVSDGILTMEDLERREDRELLRSCIAELPPLYAAVLTLYLIEEKTYEEIADIIQAPIGTVGTRITRAKQYIHHICQNKNQITL